MEAKEEIEKRHSERLETHRKAKEKFRDEERHIEDNATRRKRQSEFHEQAVAMKFENKLELELHEAMVAKKFVKLAAESMDALLKLIGQRSSEKAELLKGIFQKKTNRAWVDLTPGSKKDGGTDDSDSKHAGLGGFLKWLLIGGLICAAVGAVVAIVFYFKKAQSSQDA